MYNPLENTKPAGTNLTPARRISLRQPAPRGHA